MKSITYYTSLAYIRQEKNSILFCGGLYNARHKRRAVKSIENMKGPSLKVIRYL